MHVWLLPKSVSVGLGCSLGCMLALSHGAMLQYVACGVMSMLFLCFLPLAVLLPIVLGVKQTLNIFHVLGRIVGFLNMECKNCTYLLHFAQLVVNWTQLGLLLLWACNAVEFQFKLYADLCILLPVVGSCML